jgi:hypothetical protein
MSFKLCFRVGGLILAGLLCVNAGQKKKVSAGPAAIGWYNGDWQSGIPGQANWFYGEFEFARVYDDFVVPEGGWTVLAVFSNIRMERSAVTWASWEIRKAMEPGKGGKKVAFGIDLATQTPIAGEGPFPGDALVGCRIQVDGLHVHLPPGRYWLSVAPVGRGGQWFASATLGKNAVGEPPGNNGAALVSNTALNIRFANAASRSQVGQYGRARDFSQGVYIEAPAQQNGH